MELDSIPTGYALHACRPSPFNPSTRISFELPVETAVRLSVFDVRGREVAVLVDGVLPAGRHQVQFDSGSLPGGMYFTTLSAGGRQYHRSMLLVK